MNESVVSDHAYFADLSAHLEVHFEFSKSNHLYLDSLVSTNDCIEYLDNLIIKTPKNIVSHIRKIRVLQLRNCKSPLLFVALLDMFETMQENGQAIKTRVLRESKPLLSKLQFDDLSSILSSGGIASANLDSEIYNMQICRKIFNQPYIQQRLDESSTNIMTRIIEKADFTNLINGYIENSQIDLALDTLESSIEEEYFTTDIAALLMELYRSSNNKKRFEATFNSVSRKQEALPPCWYETANYFADIS